MGQGRWKLCFVDGSRCIFAIVSFTKPNSSLNIVLCLSKIFWKSPESELTLTSPTRILLASLVPIARDQNMRQPLVLGVLLGPDTVLWLQLFRLPPTTPMCTCEAVRQSRKGWGYWRPQFCGKLFCWPELRQRQCQCPSLNPPHRFSPWRP